MKKGEFHIMKYISTRGGGTELTAARAIIKGIADDKGLFVPTCIPELPFNLKEMEGACYRDVAKAVIGAFFDDYTEEEMKACVDGAYDEKFTADDIVEIKKAGGAYFLELFHGKTAAFKDMALSILPYLLTAAVRKENETSRICILTATSGDTGKAALEGFADVDGTEIVVFFPSSGVSQVQERQMITQEGRNTHVFAIKGNFDDAQTGVKRIFNDEEFAGELREKGIRLSSANSINIGRLIPQVAYYVYGYLKLEASGALKPGEPMNVVVPTGNFGNILAAYYAKRMGIPVGKLICASNENKVLTDFINTGVYDARREFHLTNSPSMDILVSSNLERLLWHLSDGDGDEIRRLMDKLENDRVYEISDAIRAEMKDFYGGFATVEETQETIGRMYGEHGYLLDTHTAVAYKVYENYVKETGDTAPTLIAATASAYKFADSVAKAIGITDGRDGFDYLQKLYEKTGVEVPYGLKDLDKKEIRHGKVIETGEMEDSVRKALQ